jgi:hypothetical protein
MTISAQRLSKHILAVTNTITAGNRVFSMWSVPSCYNQDCWSNEFSCEQHQPARNDISTEAEKNSTAESS